MRALPLIVRPLQRADLPAVLAIEEAVFPAPWPMSVYEAELERDDLTRSYLALQWAGDRSEARELWAKIAEQEPSREGDQQASIEPDAMAQGHADATIQEAWPSGPLLGYAGFWLFGEEAHLMTLAIAPAWQGMGLGTWLLLAVLDQMEDRGARIATLEVRESNVAARSLYKRLGFQVIGRRYRYYHDNDEDALILSTRPLDEQVMQRLRQERRRAVQHRLLALLLP